MKMKTVTIHNFRSIKESTFDLSGYSVLVGANNSGKSNILTALRVFYEHDKIKFDNKADFPKLTTDDNESWIEIEFLLTEDEYSNLKEEYKINKNHLRVRRYFKSDDQNIVKPKQANIYGYEKGGLSNNLFYGAKNISEAKLGSIIYIPEIAKTEDTLKMSGPSPLRGVLGFVVDKVAKKSKSFEELNKAFETFNKDFKKEDSVDGFSVKKLEKDINESLKEWDVEFNLDINPIKMAGIIKNLVTHNTKDLNLGQDVEIKNLGQGLQRHIIYTLLKLSSQYKDEKKPTKKEFSPDLTLILFEEPEAFLHPGQQELLNASLKLLGQEEGQQIFASTHSPFFVSKNIEDISKVVRLKKVDGVTNTYQVSDEMLDKICDRNSELTERFKTKLDDPDVPEKTKKDIRGRKLNKTDNDRIMDEESIRFLLWLDSERCCSFFSDTVLICEGASEKILIDYLIKNEWPELRAKQIYVLDAMGKFNLHRYMNLFDELGISHSVLADRDENQGIHGIVNEFIREKKNNNTRNIDFFPVDLEEFLGIDKPPDNRKDKKPLNVMWHYFENKIEKNKIEELEQKVKALFA